MPWTGLCWQYKNLCPLRHMANWRNRNPENVETYVNASQYPKGKIFNLHIRTTKRKVNSLHERVGLFFCFISWLFPNWPALRFLFLVLLGTLGNSIRFYPRCSRGQENTDKCRHMDLGTEYHLQSPGWKHILGGLVLLLSLKWVAGYWCLSSIL